MRNTLILSSSVMLLLAGTACTPEFTVTDHSFEFAAEVSYDSSKDTHRLTLTRMSGSPDNQYRIAFTIDGENTLTLKDRDGRTHEGSFNATFEDVSSRTYTLSEAAPGEHVVDLEITTGRFTQSLSVGFLKEDHSFVFGTRVVFDQETLTHSLEVELESGAATDSYTISFTIDNQEPRKTYQETFSDILVRSYPLPAAEPGEHTVNLQISTGRHQMTEEISYSVTDYSFKVQADIEYDEENLSHVLFLSLLKGSRDEQYTILYTVDGGHSVKLIGTDGKEMGASFMESFRDATVLSYDLTRAEKGRHTMQMTVSTRNYSQTLEIPYDVDALPFSIHAETDTSGATTALLLTLTAGDEGAHYIATVEIDGKAITAGGIDFSRSPIYRCTLPLLRPGRHDVSVQLTDGATIETASLNYSEPVRHPYLDIEMMYDPSSGRHIAQVGENPYQVSLSFDVSLTISGSVTICTSTYEDFYWDIKYTTKTKTMSDRSSASGIYGGNSVTLIDRDILAAKMTGSYETSNVMTYFPGGGDGECVEQDSWQKTGIERKFYTITQEKLEIHVEGEKVTGVTLRLNNTIGEMILNGNASDLGRTEIAL